MASRKLPAWMNQPKVDKISTGAGKENGLPKLSFPGKITYSYNKNECNFICEDIIKKCTAGNVILGFDIEWKVTYQTGDYRKTSVLQLCLGDNNCYIFQLIHMNGFPSELRKLLEHEKIMKVGVGIRGDMDRLNVDYGIVASGVVDLAVMANQIIGNYENWSLNGLLMNQLQLQILKTESVRCSDWEAIPLTNTQIQYAVLDAYAGILIYYKLSKKDAP